MSASLQWEDIQFDGTEEAKHGWVHDRCQKTDTRERDIPMTKELHRILLEWWIEQGRPGSGWAFPSPKKADSHCPLWSFHSTHKRIFGTGGLRKTRGKAGKHTDKMRHLMKDYRLVYKDGRNAGKPVEYFRLYDLRHTLLTRLGKNGASATLIASVAGWTTTRMASRYVHHDLADKARTIALLDHAAAEAH